jgi:hypothetical protein
MIAYVERQPLCHFTKFSGDILNSFLFKFSSFFETLPRSCRDMSGCDGVAATFPGAVLDAAPLSFVRGHLGANMQEVQAYKSPLILP